MKADIDEHTALDVFTFYYLNVNILRLIKPAKKLLS